MRLNHDFLNLLFWAGVNQGDIECHCTCTLYMVLFPHTFMINFIMKFLDPDFFVDTFDYIIIKVKESIKYYILYTTCRWGNSGNSGWLYFSGLQNHSGDCSHEIKRHLILGRKVMTNLDSILKSRDITLLTKVHLVKAMVFPMVMYGC